MEDTKKQVNTKTARARELIGTVVSVSMNQTIIVEVVRLRRHPLYRKTMKRTKHFPAHAQDGQYAVGDRVKIAETRPISKTKHFKVVGKVGK